MALLMVSETGSQELYYRLSIDGRDMHLCTPGDVNTVLATRYFDMILLDCGLNSGKGLKVLLEIKQGHPEIPVLFFTDLSSEETAIKAFRLGAKDYFKKPVSGQELRDAIDRLLAIRKYPQREKRVPCIVRETADSTYVSGLSGIPSNIMRVLNHLEENFQSHICLERLADEAGMSKHHFCRIFKKHTGASPMQFLANLRVDRAKELLKDASFTVSMVAAEVGFNDLSCFIKHFKKVTGKTPSDFKRSRGRHEAELANLTLF
ncbi:MAG: helix-turn-helix domain-containing protein [Nitrospiraceae bacterium]|nr:helix-turn-helix domain-containing protein [Nitrospiraceae bacterium]